jgi:hypothetical protein
MLKPLSSKVHFTEYRPAVPPQEPNRFIRTPAPRRACMTPGKRSISPLSLGITPLYLSENRTPIAGVQPRGLTPPPHINTLLKKTSKSPASARKYQGKRSVTRVELCIEKPLVLLDSLHAKPPSKKTRQRGKSKDWKLFSPATVREVIYFSDRSTPSLVQLPQVKPSLRTPSLRNSITECELSPNLAMPPRYFTAFPVKEHRSGRGRVHRV